MAIGLLNCPSPLPLVPHVNSTCGTLAKFSGRSVWANSGHAIGAASKLQAPHNKSRRRNFITTVLCIRTAMNAATRRLN